MKAIKIIIAVFLALFIFAMPVLAQENTNDKSEFPFLTGPYLGQKPPGMTPEIFSPGIISTVEDEGCSVFSSNGRKFILFCSTRPCGFGEDDLYISFYQKGDSWSIPVNMGEGINSSASENRPFVTLDGKYMFFTSTRLDNNPEFQKFNQQRRPGTGTRDIYWVDAKIIEEMKPGNLR